MNLVYAWGFNRMGEEIALSWTDEDCWNSEFQQASKVGLHSIGALSEGQDAEKDKVARVLLLYSPTNL
jgi:hypothetical protein